MTKQIILFAISSFLFLGWECGDDETPINPQDETDLLFASGFESNGGPDMKGWSFSDSKAKDFIALSQDVPSTFNLYSLKLQGDTITNYVPSIYTTIVILHPYTTKKYVLSYSSKGKGELSIDLRTADGSRSMMIHLSSISWQRTSSRTLFICSNNSDTLTVSFRPLSNDSTSYLLIDDVYIQAQKR